MDQIDPKGGPAPGEHNFFRGVPLAQRDAQTRTAIQKLGDAIDAGAVSAVWESALRAPEWDQTPIWIHGDLDASNLLVEQGRLAGVIDFGGLGVGDPACDVMVAWKLLSPTGRRIFRDELSVDDAMWDRSKGWAVSQAVIALAYYTRENHPTLVEASHRWLSEVLSEPRRTEA